MSTVIMDAGYESPLVSAYACSAAIQHHARALHRRDAYGSGHQASPKRLSQAYNRIYRSAGITDDYWENIA